MTKLRGSVSKRRNGTFTVTTEPRWDPEAGKKVRRSLGTFPTREAADRRRLEHNLERHSSSITRSGEDLTATTVDEFLSDWERHLGKAHAAGLIQPGTLIDYSRVVRLHIRPYLGHMEVGDLAPATMRAWVLDMADRGVRDRTIQKATRTVHRAFSDTDVPTNLNGCCSPNALLHRPAARSKHLPKY